MLALLLCAEQLAGCSSGPRVHGASPPSTLGHRLPEYSSKDGHVLTSTLASEPAKPSQTTGGVRGNTYNATLSLAQVIAAVVLADPRIRVAFADVLRARAELVRARTLDNPSLSLSQTLNPFPSSDFNAKTHQGGPPQFDLEISYSLERLLFGVRGADMKSAGRNLKASLADYANVARTRMLEGIDAYVDVLEAAELARLAREEVEQLERMESITQRRVSLGSVGRVELDRVHIAVIGGKRRALLAAAAVDNARTRLRARLGPAYIATSVDVSGGLDVPENRMPDLTKLIARALTLRPDIRAQEERLRAAQAREQRERRSGLPHVSVGAGYTRQFQERAIGFPNANSWGASVDSTLPLFDRNQAGRMDARADMFEAEATLDALRLETEAEVSEAFRSFEVAGEILETLDPEALSAATSARTAIQEAYALGGRTLLELLDAQQAYREVYREHVIARADYLRALHRLNAAVGEAVIRD
jgi:cobalt-zinc-cadmium efflux system outer membrane protein